MPEVPTQSSPTPPPAQTPEATALDKATMPVAPAPAAGDAPAPAPSPPPAAPADQPGAKGSDVDDYQQQRNAFLRGEMPAAPAPAPAAAPEPPAVPAAEASPAPAPASTPAPAAPEPTDEPVISHDLGVKKRRIPTDSAFDHTVVNYRNAGMNLVQATAAAAQALPDSPEAKEWLKLQAAGQPAPVQQPPAAPAPSDDNIPALPKTTAEIRDRLDAIEDGEVEAMSKYDMTMLKALKEEKKLLQRALPTVEAQEHAQAIAQQSTVQQQWEASLKDAVDFFGPAAADPASALTLEAQKVQSELLAANDPVAKKLDSAPYIYSLAAKRIGFKPGAAPAATPAPAIPAPVPAASVPQSSTPAPAAPGRPASAPMIASPTARTTQPGPPAEPQSVGRRDDYQNERDAYLKGRNAA